MTSARTVIRKLKPLADPDFASHSQRFFKTGPGEYAEGDRFLGIRVPLLRILAGEVADLPEQELRLLLVSSLHEIRMLALLVMVRQFADGSPAQRQRIYRQYLRHSDRINNWDLVDCSAHLIVGPYLADKDRAPLLRLARSDSLWERRIAIMATLHFIRRGQFQDTLILAEQLLHDGEDLIHKAVGWMLREVGKRDRAATEAFLKRHYHGMPRTMLRYAIERFPETLRQHYLRGTVKT